MISKFKKKHTGIKGVIFLDIDDTLFHSTNFAIDARDKSFDAILKYKKNLTKELLWKEYNRVYVEFGTNYGFHFNRIFENLKIQNKEERDKLTAIATSEYHIHKRKMLKYGFKKVESILKKLSSNYILGIISIGKPVKQWDKLYRLGLDTYFDTQNVFIEIDKSKIKNETFYFNIFKEYSKKFNTGNIYMVGDREDGDIIPSKYSNFKTIRVNTGKYNEDFNSSVADFKIKSVSNLLEVIK